MRRIAAAFAALLLLAAGPARAEWLRAESPNFIVYSEAGEQRLREQVRELEDFDGLLRSLTGTAERTPGKLHVYMLRGSGQMGRVRSVGRYVSGFYEATAYGIAAYVDEEMSQRAGDRSQTLFHEYAHHFMLQYYPAVYPSWYVEGFAEFLATARFTDTQIELGHPNEAVASWIGDTSYWVSIDWLMFAEESRVGGGGFYAMSWLLVHYLMSDPVRGRQLRDYLVAIGRGVPRRTAFAQAFAVSPRELQAALRAYMGRDLHYWRMARQSASAPPAIAVTRLPASSDGLVLAGAAMRVGVEEDQEDGFVRQVRRDAAGRDDPLARHVLARAEALHGDGEAADRLLAALLRETPGDADLLYLQGMRHLVAGRRDEPGRAAHFARAQDWFVRAHRADDSHFPTLYRYAESLSLGGSFVSENTSNVLLLAHQIAPQVDEIAYAAALLLMRREQYGEAEALLTRLTVGHRGERFTAAIGALLAKARARDNRDLPSLFRLPGDEEEND